ncbi:DNA modification methylase [Methylobacterium sp. PvP062]|uniref:Methyltransferase n=1 Tax=Methylobacterium radiotolerans TaxID=31998 RepID=A0ABV2NNL4_9HYPH|nr:MULTISPECIES: site-specific DNA-methyltransferase [unclassified Methylobacterium]MBP2495240.1 DNA modification methylase [Methylobacterium sp. PvP105]MBP2504889.1 DNA modification methylase [Methylobacterium sp. PvP109]MCX7335895.1 site-specific DNA-methyltransferase [Hyphomicrobiales bacterium]
MTVRILQGDCREVLRTLPDESVHCVVTSPPYFGLRDYGVNGQIGLEATPTAFVSELVAVFREVRRVLRKDGTLWLNLGDSYAGSWGAQGQRESSAADHSWKGSRIRNHAKRSQGAGTIRELGLKPKDLIGIPWRVAFALQADGWWLRQDIIWSKPNPMPESIEDRCTKAHEYLFLLSRSERYHFDAVAIAEPVSGPETKTGVGWGRLDQLRPAITPRGRDRIKRSGNIERKPGTARGCPEGTGSNVCGSVPWEGLTRNKRSVWTVTTAPFAEAHFATFPPGLIVDCIKAGCPAGGIVLDPFGGAGTTGLVAQRLGRDALLIELNPEYAAMAERRIAADRAGPVERDRIRHGHKPADHGPLFADPGAAA